MGFGAVEINPEFLKLPNQVDCIPKKADPTLPPGRPAIKAEDQNLFRIRRLQKTIAASSS